jgi:hypothetical protein
MTELARAQTGSADLHPQARSMLLSIRDKTHKRSRCAATRAWTAREGKKMKGWTGILAAIVALTALSLASPLAAADEAGKTPLKVDVTGLFEAGLGDAVGSAKFTLLGASTADTDSGTVTYRFSFGATTKSRAGQTFTPISGTNTLKGRHGRLVIRTSGRRFELGSGHDAWTGSWSIVRGTDKYAGLKGNGGYAAVVTPDDHFFFEYEGYVTRS